MSMFASAQNLLALRCNLVILRAAFWPHAIQRVQPMSPDHLMVTAGIAIFF